MVTATEARRVISRAAADPLWFFREVLGEKAPRPGLYDKQAAILESVRVSRRTAVLGCQSSGKDWTAGRMVLWWLASHSPAKVIITGPSFRQVTGIVWKETRLAYYTAFYPLGGEMLENPQWKIADDQFALGFATDSPFSLMGFHSPNLLIIVTEAHAMKQDDMEALKRLNPSRMLLTGNPLCSAGEFYDAFHANAELWHTVQIAAADTPNIKESRMVIPGMLTVEDVEERKKEWGVDSPLYQASILGQFPESLEDTLIPRTWIDRSLGLAVTPEKPSILGLDVGRGGDKTVLFRRDGPSCEIVWRGLTPDIMQAVGRTGLYLSEHPECENRVVVDDVGIGGGVTDRLREQGVKVIAFAAGAQAQNPKRWANAGSEAWGLMAEALREGKLKIPNDPVLISQLTSRKYKIQSDRRIILESKDDLKSRGGRSPDETDALSQTFSPMATRRVKVWV